jgi:hypothetical protein
VAKYACWQSLEQDGALESLVEIEAKLADKDCRRIHPGALPDIKKSLSSDQKTEPCQTAPT